MKLVKIALAPFCLAFFLQSYSYAQNTPSSSIVEWNVTAFDNNKNGYDKNMGKWDLIIYTPEGSIIESGDFNPKGYDKRDNKLWNAYGINKPFMDFIPRQLNNIQSFMSTYVNDNAGKVKDMELETLNQWTKMELVILYKDKDGNSCEVSYRGLPKKETVHITLTDARIVLAQN